MWKQFTRLKIISLRDVSKFTQWHSWLMHSFACTNWSTSYTWFLQRNHPTINRVLIEFLSASLYFSKRGAYWDRLCRDVVGRWLVGWLVVTRVHCGQTVHPRPIVTRLRFDVLHWLCARYKLFLRLRLRLLWNTNRKPYPRNSMVQISTPWGDP